MVEYHRSWRATDEGRAKMRAGVRASCERYPERERARYELRLALLRGDLAVGPCYVDGCDGKTEAHHWATEPAMGRLVDGIPGRLAQLRVLGNAVIPQVAELVGRRLLAIDAALRQEHAA